MDTGRSFKVLVIFWFVNGRGVTVFILSLWIVTYVFHIVLPGHKYYVIKYEKQNEQPF